MPANPMQRKARNSFLLGILVMLIISLIVGVLLYFLVLQDGEAATKKGEQTIAYVYKIKDGITVSSGQEITVDMVEEVETYANAVPQDSIPSKIKSDDDLQTVPFPTGYKTKINLTPGTVISANLLYAEDKTDNTLRYVEYNMISLPSRVSIGDYMDIRIMLPTGQDFIIVSKKPVVSINETTIGFYLTEEEITTMSCAIIDAYIMTASNIYAIQYVEPGMQEKATPTYPVNAEVFSAITKNPNIAVEARNALITRMNGDGTSLRNNVNTSLGEYVDNGEAIENIEERMQEQIEKARELYLSGLAGY